MGRQRMLRAEGPRLLKTRFTTDRSQADDRCEMGSKCGTIRKKHILPIVSAQFVQAIIIYIPQLHLSAH